MTPENDALAGAILWLKEDEPADSRLLEASFGRRADGSGCWWFLEFQRSVRDGEVQDSRQDDERRILLVIEAWVKAFFIAAPDQEED
jgi:hypothetical protein